MTNNKDIRTLLAEAPFFDGMSQEYLTTMAACGKLVHFKPGQFLLREGQKADTFYLIRHGDVAIESDGSAGGPLSIARVGAGDITGYSWLFPPYRNGFDSLALTPVSALALDGECLRAKADNDHELGYQLMKRFAQVMLDRLQSTRRQMLDVYANTEAGDDGSN